MNLSKLLLVPVLLVVGCAPATPTVERQMPTRVSRDEPRWRYIHHRLDQLDKKVWIDTIDPDGLIHSLDPLVDGTYEPGLPKPRQQHNL